MHEILLSLKLIIVKVLVKQMKFVKHAGFNELTETSERHAFKPWNG